MFDGTPQEPPRPAQPAQPDPLELQLGQEWAAAQLGQQHVGECIGKIVEAWRKSRAEIAAKDARIAELEAELAAARNPAGTVEPS